VDHTLVDGLTVREQEVLQLMSERMTNGEISDRLGISTQTAKNYSSRVLQKLGLRRRSELTQLFVAPRKRAG
jgi:DNA-binding CsgD family transcriptional regulator